MERTGSLRGVDQATTRRLAHEHVELTAAIALVASGAATRVAVGGMRFGQLLADRLHDEATRQGVVVATEPWPEDSGGHVVVRRLED